LHYKIISISADIQGCTNKIGSTILKEWTTPDFGNALNYKPRRRRDLWRPRKRWQRVDAEQVKRPNPWRRKMMMIKEKMISVSFFNLRRIT
jgi:hypothetical protein